MRVIVKRFIYITFGTLRSPVNYVVDPLINDLPAVFVWINVMQRDENWSNAWQLRFFSIHIGSFKHLSVKIFFMFLWVSIWFLEDFFCLVGYFCSLKFYGIWKDVLWFKLKFQGILQWILHALTGALFRISFWEARRFLKCFYRDSKLKGFLF